MHSVGFETTTLTLVGTRFTCCTTPPDSIGDADRPIVSANFMGEWLWCTFNRQEDRQPLLYLCPKHIPLNIYTCR